MSMTAENRFFYNLSTNNSTKIRQFLKSPLGMSIETRINRLMKTTGVKKSRWNVPLRKSSRSSITTLFFYLFTDLLYTSVCNIK
jgi:hypothetical protein